MDFFTNILSVEELSEHLKLMEAEQGIELGTVTSYEPEMVKQFAELWCEKVDTIVQIDIEVNGKPSTQAEYLMAHRGFTYSEFQDLFNPHIDDETKFPYYPVFNQIRKSKGGIISHKQRHFYTTQYQPNDQEDYCKAYCSEEAHTRLLLFFLGALDKLSILLPLKKIKQHIALIAPTGSGKSELIRSMFYRMQKKYPSCTMIMVDPHGDLGRSIRDNRLTYQQRDRLIYIDPYLDKGVHTPTFNPFQLNDPSEKTIQYAVEMFISAFKEILTHEGGALTENMVSTLEKSLYFIFGRENSTLGTLVELFKAESPLKEEANAFDPIFDDYFFKPGNKTRDGLQSRLARLLNNPTLKRVLAGSSTFDLEHALNSGKLLIFDLSGFGEMAGITFGKFLIASIKSYIRKRDKNTGIPVFCFVDEAHVLVSGSYEYILSQLRGFGLHMILATQFISQYGLQAKGVLKNTAIKVVGGDVEDDVKEVFKVPKDFKLKDYHFALKVRGKELTSFKSPSFLLKNPRRYALSESQLKEMLAEQIERYYKPIGQEGFTPRREQKSNPDQDSDTQSKPPFDLFLGDDS